MEIVVPVQSLGSSNVELQLVLGWDTPALGLPKYCCSPLKSARFDYLSYVGCCLWVGTVMQALIKTNDVGGCHNSFGVTPAQVPSKRGCYVDSRDKKKI